MTRASLEHRFNGLHVYCRLRDLMIPPRYARPMAKVYEIVAHRVLYRSNGRIEFGNQIRPEKKEVTER